MQVPSKIDNGRATTNKRLIQYDVVGSVPDGLKVAPNGSAVSPTSNTLSAMNGYGEMIARVQTNFTIHNLV